MFSEKEKEGGKKQIKRRRRSRIILEPAEKYDDICSELLLGTSYIDCCPIYARHVEKGAENAENGRPGVENRSGKLTHILLRRPDIFISLPARAYLQPLVGDSLIIHSLSIGLFLLALAAHWPRPPMACCFKGALPLCVPCVTCAQGGYAISPGRQKRERRTSPLDCCTSSSSWDEHFGTLSGKSAVRMVIITSLKILAREDAVRSSSDHERWKLDSDARHNQLRVQIYTRLDRHQSDDGNKCNGIEMGLAFPAQRINIFED